MSFTQKNEINIKKCDGCDKYCEIGVDYQKIEYQTKKGIRVEEFIYPSLGGTAIETYLDKTGKKIDTCVMIFDNKILLGQQIKKVTPEIRLQVHKEMLKKAHFISCLCDHYKTK